jgi:hypothetical protein
MSLQQRLVKIGKAARKTCTELLVFADGRRSEPAAMRPDFGTNRRATGPSEIVDPGQFHTGIGAREVGISRDIAPVGQDRG